MMTRYDVWLNEIKLSAIHESIIVRDIAYESPAEETKSAAMANKAGTLVTARTRRSSSVIITFEIHERDTLRRQEICRRIQAWARDGGLLRTSDRRGQQLRVECDRLPVISSALKWTQTLQIVFTAYAQPYWEDVREIEASMTGTDAHKDVYIPGIAERTLVSVTARNVSGGVVDRITLTAGETQMTFEGLALENEKVLVIEYDEKMIQTIRVGTLSRAKRRTAESSDDLYVRCGDTCRLRVEADGDVRATFHVRGLWP